MSETATCPECANGKPVNCTGRALYADDTMGPCLFDCKADPAPVAPTDDVEALARALVDADLEQSASMSTCRPAARAILASDWEGVMSACTYRLADGPLVCTRTDPHATGHVFVASEAPDRHGPDDCNG